MKKIGRLVCLLALTQLNACTLLRTIQNNDGIKNVGSDPQLIATHVQTIAEQAKKPLEILSAGDIANCGIFPSIPNSQADYSAATGQILKQNPYALILTAGDNAYLDATSDDFEYCYDPRWGGELLTRTLPSPGNHEYGIINNRKDAEPYFYYFGKNAGPQNKGYYSVDYGTWHIISLNSQIIVLSQKEAKFESAVDEQYQWLQKDLEEAKNSHAKCILAVWHHPLYDYGKSSTHSHELEEAPKANVDLKKIWSALKENHADVVINGHEHFYDMVDPGKNNIGIREFIVGNGGTGQEIWDYFPWGSDPDLETEPEKAYGVLKMTLYNDHYDWRLIPIDDKKHQAAIDKLDGHEGTSSCYLKQ